VHLRLGLIGAGYWGTHLIRTLAGRHDVELRAVADLDAERLRDLDPAVRRAANAEALCSDVGINAIMVATPPSTHFALARDVLRAGKHCWVEKPLALRPDDAGELVRLAMQQQRTLFVDETFLYDPLVQRARSWIQHDRLGRVHHYSFERLNLGRVRRDSDVWWNSAPHDLALLRFLAPAEIIAIRVDRFSYLQPGIADVCVGTARLDDGASAHFYMSWLSPVKSGRVVVVGSEGMLVYDGRFGDRSLTLHEYAVADPAAVTANVVPIERFTPVETIRGGSEEPLALAVEAFLHAVRTGAPTPSDGSLSLKTVELLAAAERSQI
jgi:predicted dehydrogenase